MAKKKTPTNRAKPIPFEQSLEQLNQIVGELENGNLTLSDSLKKYEQGVSCLNQCFETLNQAQRKIELLVDLDEDGNLVTRPFDDRASAEITDGVRRSERVAGSEIDDENGLEEDVDDADRLF